MTFSQMKVSKPFAYKLELAVKALAIVLAILWLGSIVYAFVERDFLYFPFLFNFDLGLIFIMYMLVSAVSNLYSLVFVVLGWSVAAIYVKREAGKESATIIVLSAFLPVLLYDVTLAIILITMVITNRMIVFLPIILLILAGILLYGAFSFVLTIPGLIVANAFSFKNRKPAVQISQPNYLVLDVIPQEKPLRCPFRMQDHHGCAYLGYRAPEAPLICDYESQWRSCYIYAELYKKIDKELK